MEKEKSFLNNPNFFCGLFVFLVSFLVFFKTMTPGLAFWDCGEFATAAFTLGIPHPPSAPFFVLVGRLFSMIPFSDVGVRVTMFSVITGALALTLMYLVIVRLIEEYGDIENYPWIKHFAGIVAVLTLGFSYTYWTNAIESEVYGPSLTLMVFAIWLLFKWADNADKKGADKLLLLIAYLFGLGTGLHLLVLLTIPTILIMIFFINRKLLLNYKLFALMILFYFLGASTYYILMIRSQLNPYMDENNPENWENLKYLLSRKQYGDSMLLNIFNRKADFWGYQFNYMFLRYFLQEFNLIAYFIGIFGAIWHFFKDKRRFLAIAALFIITGLGLVVYLNMENPQVREREYIYAGCYAAFAIWIGIGIAGLIEGFISFIYKIREKYKFLSNVMIGLFLLILLLMPIHLFLREYRSHNRTGNYISEDYAINILDSCEPNAILFTNGDNDTFPLWYVQQCLGFRKDVAVVNLSLLGTEWYCEQLKSDHYGNLPIKFSFQELKMIPPYQEDEKGNVILYRDIMAKHIIENNAGKRPVYYAATVPTENTSGFDKYFRMDGMVFKVLLYGQQEDPYDISYLEKNFNKFKFRGILDENGETNYKVYKSPTEEKLIGNYVIIALQLSDYYLNKALEKGKVSKDTTLNKDFSKMSDKEKGLYYIQKAKKIKPNDFYPYFKEAKFYEYIGDSTKAKEIYIDMATRIEFDKNLFMKLIPELTVNTNQPEAVKILLEKFVANDTSQEQMYKYLLSLYMHDKEIDKAQKLLKRWQKYNPDDIKMEQYFESLK